MLYSLKKYSAFFLGPVAAVFMVVAVFRGPYLFQNIDSLARISEAFVGFSQCLVTLAPAAFMMFIIGLPVFYLLRWIIHWKLWSCVLGAATGRRLGITALGKLYLRGSCRGSATARHADRRHQLRNRLLVPDGQVLGEWRRGIGACLFGKFNIGDLCFNRAFLPFGWHCIGLVEIAFLHLPDVVFLQDNLVTTV